MDLYKRSTGTIRSFSRSNRSFDYKKRSIRSKNRWSNIQPWSELRVCCFTWRMRTASLFTFQSWTPCFQHNVWKLCPIKLIIWEILKLSALLYCMYSIYSTVHIAQTQLANPNEPYTLYSNVRGPVVLDLEVTVGGGPFFCYWLQPQNNRVEWFWEKNDTQYTLYVVPNCCRTQILKFHVLTFPIHFSQGLSKFWLLP